ncbi:MAG: hydrogenase nickel incorporation protein HypB [Nitrospinae bacterium]|nr:hydrogenase nickel incorporation protein HypB [Nitrospinota bacterium]
MSKTIRIEKRILEKNDVVAARLRQRFADIVVVNIMSSPGAGKTTLLEETVKRLSGKTTIGVIEGDIATDYDAQRVESAGAGWVVQINTGGVCHLDAGMVEQALDSMPEKLGLLVIENVGNLVCPSGFDLGDDYKVVLASVTEGLDKPKKYPGMYRKSHAMVLNKIDLSPHVNVSPAAFVKEALDVNPALTVFQTSATAGTGLDEWCGWLSALKKPANA